ncbi:MAG TPA: DUF6468 domain-containing protein [Rhizomicrobium sp.]|nr:DUF6468 domain-containing protein [Rhizomicrobium sp.]
MTLTLVVELILTALLAATLFYCIVLERKLAALRSGQDGLKKTLASLNAAVAAASTSMVTLKSTAGEITQILDERLGHARGLADELGVLCGSGERIVQRFDRELDSRATKSDLPSAAVMGRLDAGRLASLGAVR